MLVKSKSNNDEKVVIANDYFVFNYFIDQKEELEVGGGGVGGGITPPVAETTMVNDTNRLNIYWGKCRGGRILLTQPSFSIP